MVLGLPSYGYLYSSTVSSLRTRQDQPIPAPSPATIATSASITPGSQILNSTSLSAQPTSTLEPVGSGSQPSNVTLVDPDGSGQIQFRDLVLQGVLQRDNPSTTSDASGGLPGYHASGGFTRYWDDCSSTPYLRSEAARQVVTYDDPQSLVFKTLFAKRMGMRGVNIFDVHGDTNEGDLIRAVKRAMGLS